MPYGGRRLILALRFALAAVLAGGLAVASPSAASAQGLFAQPKYAAIVVDANTGEVLYAKRADALRYPASITKVMTLYLTFEALATGRLSLGERIPVSAHAASMAPSKTNLRPGETLTVDEAIHTVAIHSANDIAVALAERIGGSEPRFAQLMTLRAQELGMANSRFVNASGLPDNRQVTSARDIALLSRAVMRDYPQYYTYFGQNSYAFHGQLFTNHNHLMQKMPGMDGLKTGFTNAAGFNLAASAVRDGHRLITVVLGGPSTAARDENVEELLNAGFAVLDQRTRGSRITLASEINEPDDEMAGPIQRAPVEQGSGEQPDLKVVVQPQIRTLPMMAAVKALSPRLATPQAPDDLASAPAKPPSVRITPTPPSLASSGDPCDAIGHGRRARRARAACRRDAMARIDTRDRTDTRDVARGRAEAGLRGRDVADDDAVASAAPCPPRGRHRRHACPAHGSADDQLAAKPSLETRRDHADDLRTARNEPGKDGPGRGEMGKAAGGYMIQVGAYKNSGQAKDHLGRVAETYGQIVGDASARVEKAGGNYRVRFRGLNQREAKAACHALAAKRQPCVVMDATT